MKTTRYTVMIGVLTAAVTLATSAMAFEQPFSPKMYDVKPRVIQGTGVQNPNLLAGLPSPGSRAKAAHPVVSTGIQDPDLLMAVKNCPMSPKLLDTAACKKMCEAAGMK